MKVGFIGCVQFSFTMLEHLLNSKDVEVVSIVTRGKASFNSDFKSLAPIAEKNKIPFLMADGHSQCDIAAWFHQTMPDIIFCLGWSHLLDKSVLSSSKYGVIGYHPAPLPLGRGRHPLIWTLVLGLPETASCFFMMDSGVDTGDIVSRVSIPVTGDDNAASLMGKVTASSKAQIDNIIKELIEGRLATIPQFHDKATNWRRRTQADGAIDWRMSSQTIHNLVRGLSRPYIGAHFMHQGQEIKVWSTVCYGSDEHHVEPGKVLNVEGKIVHVKCGVDSIMLLEHEIPKIPRVGDYI